jgi:hypothetical protein
MHTINLPYSIIIVSIGVNNNNIDINIDLLLHGNISFSYDLNTEIFQAVHKFIIDTHRFISDASFFQLYQ